jgi:hypothetical protein
MTVKRLIAALIEQQRLVADAIAVFERLRRARRLKNSPAGGASTAVKRVMPLEADRPTRHATNIEAEKEAPAVQGASAPDRS